MPIIFDYIKPQHEMSLYRLFDDVIDTGSFDFFHPHPFDNEQAHLISNNPGKNIYIGLFNGEEMCAYGLLRGWDEGFSIPSLGIYVVEKYRGTGLSKQMMVQLHEIAKEKGSERIRLTVMKRNEKAIALYVKMGYAFQTKDADSLIGECAL